MFADVKPSFKYDVVNSTHPRVRSLNNLSCRLIRDLLQARLEKSIFSRLVRILTMLPMLLFYRLIFPPGAVFLVGSSASWSCRFLSSDFVKFSISTTENCRTSSIYKSCWQIFEKIKVSFSSAFASQKIWPFFLATAPRWNGAHGPSEWSVG